MTFPSSDYTHNLYKDYIPGVPFEKIVRGNLNKEQKILLADFLKSHPDAEKAFFKTQSLKIFENLGSEAQKIKLANDFMLFKKVRSMSSVKSSDIGMQRKTKPESLIPLFKLEGNKTDMGNKFSLLQKMVLDHQLEIHTLATQSTSTPLIKEAIQRISESFSMYPKEISMSDLRNLLENQFKNLKLLSDWSKNPQNIAGNIILGKENLSLIELELRGEKLLGPEKLSRLLRTEPSNITPPLLEDRPSILVSSIEAQIQKIDQMKKTKESLLSSQQIVSRGDSSGSDVFQIESAPETFPEPSLFDKLKYAVGLSVPPVPRPTETVGFIKMSKNPEEDATRSERIAFSIADALGLADLFVPTGTMTVSGKREPMERRESKTILHLKEQEKTQKATFQVPIAGNLLSDFVDGKVKWNKISHNELTRGMLASAVMGHFDLHSNNVMVTDEGKWKLFDNTRTNANGEGYINYGGMLLLTTRNTLVSHPDTLKKYTPEQIEKLKFDIQEIKRHAQKDVMGLINSPLFQAEIEKLPKGWFNLETAPQLLLKRINLIQTALNEGKITSARDILLAANPLIKFEVLTLLLHPEFKTNPLNNKEAQTILIANAGGNSLYDLLEYCKQERMNPYEILQISQLDIPLEQMIDEVGKKLQVNRASSFLLEDKILNDMLCERFYNEIVEISEVDLKESPDAYEYDAFLILKDHCERNNISFYSYANEEADSQSERDKAVKHNQAVTYQIEHIQPFDRIVLLKDEEKGTVAVFRRLANGEIEERESTYVEKCGKIRFAGEGELKSVAQFQKEQTPEYYQGKLNDDQALALIAKAPEKSFLLYLNSNNHLILMQKRPVGQPFVHQLIPTDNPEIFKSSISGDDVNVYHLHENYTMIERP